MLVTLSLFWALAALELMLWLVPSLQWRRVMGAMLSVPMAAISIALFALYPNLATGLLLLITLYRLVNLLRLVKARVNEQYLRRSTLYTSLWLITAQGLVTLCWLLQPFPQLGDGKLWTAISYVNLLLAAVVLVSTLRNVWTTRAPKLDHNETSDSQLPTLTVAIPARNETADLEACLTSLVASNYPKLEILVLDDCSQNKRTPEIIRSYAHAGVRFLQGKEPEENWLAKNQAYQQLCDEANGELVLFCGVDARFTPNSLRLLVAALQHKHKSMISIIPRNIVPPVLTARGTVLLQTMRYAWELALPRRLFNRPPVLSTCWLIRREVLTSAGGFAAVSRSIVPESYFARVSAVHDGYSFMRSNPDMGIVSNKGNTEQRSTATRVQYPRVHRRIELVLLVSAAELLLCVVPYVWLALILLSKAPQPALLVSIATLVLLTAAYSVIVVLTYRTWLVRSLFLLPFAALYDVALLHYSMLRYEFFSVIWKDRNVCIPVMRVVEPAPER